MTIDKEKLDNIFHKEMNKKDKKMLIEIKLKDVLNSMKLNKNEEDNNNMKEIKLNKENFLNKQLLSNKEEELFYKNFKERNNKLKHQDKITREKFSKENSKENKIQKCLKKQIAFIDYKTIFYQ